MYLWTHFIKEKIYLDESYEFASKFLNLFAEKYISLFKGMISLSPPGTSRSVFLIMMLIRDLSVSKILFLRLWLFLNLFSLVAQGRQKLCE